MAKKPVSKLGRGLSALMADIAVPEVAAEPASKPAPKPATKPATKPKKATSKKPAKKTTKNPSRASAPTAKQTAEVLGGVLDIPIDLLERNPHQPRRYFDKAKLVELTNSVMQKGVLQPILVRPLPASYGMKGQRIDNRYQIVAGERRWQAAQSAGLETMPVLIRDLSDREVLEIGVIENVQRADLNPIDEAQAYQALIDQFGRKQAEIAKATGKSRSHVANCLRLLGLPLSAQEYLQDGKITAGHARAILSAPDPQALAELIVKDGLSVRAAEKWAKAQSHQAQNSKKGAPDHDPNIHFIERQLSQNIGMAVTINHKSPGGSLSVKYKTTDELNDLVRRLKKS